MKLPEIPTDNLYKFLAIFGLIISLFSGYWLIKLPFSNISLTFILILFGVLVLGCVISICGFRLWYKRTQKVNDEILVNESKKNKLENDLYIHKSKYDNEVKLYKELWDPLSLLKSELDTLNTEYKRFIQQENDNEDEYHEKLRKIYSEKVYPHFEKFYKILNSNEPFLPKELFIEFDNLKMEFYKVASHALFAPEFIKLRKTANMNIESELEKLSELNEKLKKIADTVRNRIGKLDIKD